MLHLPRAALGVAAGAFATGGAGEVIAGAAAAMPVVVGRLKKDAIDEGCGAAARARWRCFFSRSRFLARATACTAPTSDAPTAMRLQTPMSLDHPRAQSRRRSRHRCRRVFSWGGPRSAS